MYLLLRLVIREYLYLPDHFCEIEQKNVQFHSFFLKFLIIFFKKRQNPDESPLFGENQLSLKFSNF
jgi:hypothetical protein